MLPPIPPKCWLLFDSILAWVVNAISRMATTGDRGSGFGGLFAWLFIWEWAGIGEDSRLRRG